jgi:hypothetical protein
MKTIRRRAAQSAVLALALAVAGCASGGREVDDAFDNSSPEAQEAQLTAQNQNFSDATLYAVWDAGNRQRLGMVTGLTSQTFKLDIRGSELRLQVDFIAGGNFTSDRIMVNPGDHVQVTIPPA